MKQKMDIETKAKLIYSIELGVFALVFINLAILKATGVIPTDPNHVKVFNWITLFGGTWLVVDFMWAFLSQKRQKRVSLLDKVLHLPAGFYLIAFDIICLLGKQKDEFYRYGIPIVLGYLGLCYTFEAIYHFWHPIPGLLDSLKEQEKKEANEQDVQPVEETNQPEEEKKEDE